MSPPGCDFYVFWGVLSIQTTCVVGPWEWALCLLPSLVYEGGQGRESWQVPHRRKSLMAKLGSGPQLLYALVTSPPSETSNTNEKVLMHINELNPNYSAHESHVRQEGFVSVGNLDGCNYGWVLRHTTLVQCFTDPRNKRFPAAPAVLFDGLLHNLRPPKGNDNIPNLDEQRNELSWATTFTQLSHMRNKQGIGR